MWFMGTFSSKKDLKKLNKEELEITYVNTLR